MENIRYTAKRLSEILKLAPKEIAEATGKVADVTAKKDIYTLEDLVKLRTRFRRMPESMGLRVQLFLNFKGGTGKTSLSSSYAFRLAERGYRVLLIDLDSQGHATKCVGKEGASFVHTLYDVLIKKKPMRDTVVATGMPGLSLVPSNLHMSTIELALMPLAGREFRLRNALKEVEAQFDFIVMDAPPSFGLLNLNALMAASDLFVPVLADFLSYDGLKLLFETVQGLEEDLSYHLDNIFIVVNAYNHSFKIAREAHGALREHYSDYLLRQVVRQCTKFAQASSEGCPIFGFDPYSKGATDIEAMIEEVFKRIQASATIGSETAAGA
jgi:chromosome partitioning protein